MLDTSFPLLRTKLNRPPVTPDLVPRPALLDRLEQGRRHALTLVSTPAGYGKSTLLSHWLDTLEGGSWISLEPHDDDFRTFLTYSGRVEHRGTGRVRRVARFGPGLGVAAAPAPPGRPPA